MRGCTLIVAILGAVKVDVLNPRLIAGVEVLKTGLNKRTDYTAIDYRQRTQFVSPSTIIQLNRTCDSAESGSIRVPGCPTPPSARLDPIHSQGYYLVFPERTFEPIENG